MPVLSIFGEPVELAATLCATAPTRDPSAWLHHRHVTVRLTGRDHGLRVHTAGRGYAGRPASAEAGAWILLGDVIHSAGELARSRSLPAPDPSGFTAFTHVSEAVLEAGTVLNLGIASAKFGGDGGGIQAEYAGGPRIVFRPFTGQRWHGRWARA